MKKITLNRKWYDKFSAVILENFYFPDFLEVISLEEIKKDILSEYDYTGSMINCWGRDVLIAHTARGFEVCHIRKSYDFRSNWAYQSPESREGQTVGEYLCANRLPKDTIGLIRLCCEYDSVDGRETEITANGWYAAISKHELERLREEAIKLEIERHQERIREIQSL